MKRHQHNILRQKSMSSSLTYFKSVASTLADTRQRVGWLLHMVLVEKFRSARVRG